MLITVETVREAVRKDDNPYMNNEILRLIGVAEASLFVAIGYKQPPKHDDTSCDRVVPQEKQEQFENLAKNYIIEYVRGSLEQIDNDKTLTILAVQCEALLEKRTDSPDDSPHEGGSHHGNRKKRKD